MAFAQQPEIQHTGVPVTLRFEDGVEKRIVVASGEFVLDAALRQGVPLVSQCRSGICSTCVATILEGDVAPIPGRAVALLPSEIAEGRRLLCVSHAHAPSVIREHYPSTLIDPLDLPRALAQGQAAAITACVAALEWPGATVAKLSLELEDGREFDFQSGQYVRIRVPGTALWRSYSMASTPRELPRLEFLVRIIAGGAMSQYLRTRARVGDPLEIEGPRGAFVMRPRRASHIFVAGGTGLAPILSLIDAMRRRSGPRSPSLLSFGCSSTDDFFYRDELEIRQWWMPELRVRLSGGRHASAASGLLRGNPVEAIAADDFRDADPDAYLCGPPAMIEAARLRLVELGLNPERIYAERFVAS
jgi:benzoate/toluate 1,2-dioxygenase reductase subunit